MTTPATVPASPLSAEGFRLESDAIHLPRGAWARTHRRTLYWRDRPLFALTQGRFRPYLYPVLTPAGFAVTSEAPADHPHHNSLWIAADHVHCRHEVGDGRIEEYTYNFYTDETFQGRAPGRLIETACTATALPGRCRIEQSIEWLGPPEWAAPEGRLVAKETRSLVVKPGERAHLIDIQSSFVPTEWDIAIGPTRHAWLSFRMAEQMRASLGGRLVDSAGRLGGAAVTGAIADWVDCSGPVGGGHVAGIAALLPRGTAASTWIFATDWGVVTLDPFRDDGRLVRRGESLELAWRLVVHDGDAESADIAGHFSRYAAELAESGR